MRPLAILLVTSVCAAAGKPPAPLPSEFYVVREFFSDNLADWAKYILDVRPDGPDSVVRLARVAQANAYCTAPVVWLTEKRVTSTAPGDLVRRNNPCGVQAAKVKSVLKQYAQHGTIWDTSQIGIVSRCGEESRILKLPYPEMVRWDQLKRERPEIARLWDLIYDVQRTAFGASPFAKLVSSAPDLEEDLRMQEAGQKFVPELLAGRFAEGFQSGWKPNASLSHPPVPSTVRPRGQLANAGTYSFDRYAAAVYPPLALQARISGRVELELEVDRSTGEIRSAAVKSGHPLLAPAAVSAAKEWRFRAGTTPDRFTVTVEFSPHCP